MAIDIEWQIRPPHKNDSGDKPKLFPRKANVEVVDENLVAKKLAAHSGMSMGVALDVLEDMGAIIAGLLREGKDINISSLGRFSLSICCDEDVYSDTKKSQQKVAVRGVRFQANKELMEVVGEPTFREVARNADIVATSVDALIPLLDEYFKTHSHITRAEFESTFNLKRTTAFTRLKELEEMGVIKQEGAGKDTKYIKA